MTKMKTGWRASGIGVYSGDGETIAWKVLDFEYKDLGNDWLLEEVANFLKVKPTSWESVIAEFRRRYRNREGIWVCPTKKDAMEWYSEYGDGDEPYGTKYYPEDQVTKDSTDGFFVLLPETGKEKDKIVLATGVPYYHGTSRALAEKAKESGFIKDPVYVTDNKKHAIFFAKTRLRFNPDKEQAKKDAVILELAIKGWPLTEDPDPEAQQDKYKGQLFITSGVPFSRVVGIESVADIQTTRKTTTKINTSIRKANKNTSKDASLGSTK